MRFWRSPLSWMLWVLHILEVPPLQGPCLLQASRESQGSPLFGVLGVPLLWAAEGPMGPPLRACTKGCCRFWGPRGPSFPDSLLRGAGVPRAPYSLWSPCWCPMDSSSPGSSLAWAAPSRGSPHSRLSGCPSPGPHFRVSNSRGSLLFALPRLKVAPLPSASTGRSPHGCRDLHPPLGLSHGDIPKNTFRGPHSIHPKGISGQLGSPARSNNRSACPDPVKKTKPKPNQPGIPKDTCSGALQISLPPFLQINPAKTAQDIRGEVPLPGQLRDPVEPMLAVRRGCRSRE